MIKRFLLLSSLISSFSFALKMSPIEMNFTPGGKGRTQTVVLDNNTNEIAAISMSAYERKIDEKGEEVKVPTKDFKVFPPSRRLNPGEKRSFRVTYIGDQKISNEKAYRLVVKQLPLDLSVLQKKAKELNSKVYVNVNVSYVASLYVAPENAQADLEIKVKKGLAGNKYESTITNKGNAHGILKDFYVTAEVDGQIKSLSPSQFGNDFLSTNILANSKRDLIIQFPENVQVNSQTIQFTPIKGK